MFHQRPSLGKSLSIGIAKGSDSLSPKLRRDRLPRNLGPVCVWIGATRLIGGL